MKCLISCVVRGVAVIVCKGLIEMGLSRDKFLYINKRLKVLMAHVVWMNFFSAKIVSKEGKLIVDGEDFAVEIPKERHETFKYLEGKEIYFGIRPEDIFNPDFSPPGLNAAKVDATVDVTELMGNEIFLYLMIGDTQFVARVDPRSRYTIGEKVKVDFNMDNFHIFDPSADQENPVAVR